MKRKFLIPFISLIFLFTLSVLFILFNTFKIKTVIIHGETQNVQGLAKLNNQNLLFLDSNKFVEDLLEQNLLISSASARKEYPNRLVIHLYARKPVAVVIDKFSEHHIDKEGILLPKREDIDLPKIEIFNIQVFSGQKGDWRMVKAVALVANMSKQGILVDRIIIDERQSLFQMFLKEDILVFIPYNFEQLSVAASLQIIMSRFKIEGKRLRKVDFRFEKPIAILSNGEEISSN